MKNKILLVIVFFFLIVSNNQAQQIDIDVRVSPPYQLNLDGLTNQLLATVRNTNLEASANNINFRLELYGPKGLRISSNRVFDEDIDLEPGEVRQFIGNDWDALYESSNLTITPIQEKQDIINRQSLRAGKYKICITAFSTITNERLSKGVPSDCADFTVEVPDAPEIIFPIANYKIPQDGSPLHITWQQLNIKTSPTYMVEIVDLTKFPNIYSMEVEGFNYAEKVYQEDEIHAFQHTVEDVDWEVGHQYAVRVTAILGTNNGALSGNKLHSKQVKIMYEGNAIADDDKEVKDTPVPTPKDDDKEEAIVDNTPSNTSVGDTIYVGENGEFPLILSELTGTKAAYEGKGTVFIDWLQARVNVSFKKITLSTDRKLLTGKVIVDIDEDPPTYPKNWALEAAASNTWTNSLTGEVTDWVKGVSGIELPYKSVNEFTTPLSMPFGLNFGEDNRLVVTEMMFTKDKSQFNIIAAKSTPLDWGEPQTIGFIAKEIVFHPASIEPTPKRLELIADVFIDNADNTSYTFIAPVTARTGSYIEWNENGFSKFGLELDIDLSRDWLIPSNDKGTKKVKVNLITQGSDWDDLLFTGDLPKSEIVGSGGVVIEAKNISYDMSDVLNATGITFPKNYQGEKSKLFRGFYAKKMIVKLPEAWKTSSNGALEINASNLILDNTGITINADATNVADFNTTSVVDMAASVDKVHIEIISNSLTDATVNGKIALPITDVKKITNNSKIDYTASLHIVSPQEKAQNKHSYFQLALNATENQEIDFDLIHSKLKLDATSNIVAYIGSDKKTFKADLTGDVNITDIKVGPLDLNSVGMHVENMVLAYDSSPKGGFTFDKDKKMVWTFSSPQKALTSKDDDEGFPISFSEIDYETKTKSANEYLRGALLIESRINLTKNITGKTTIAIVAAIEENNSFTKFTPKYIETNLEKIVVNADLKAVVIDGEINIRKDDPVYGNGFKGALKANFKVPVAQVDAIAEFGKVNNYRYWRVEAGAKFETPIPLAGAVAFYGFGGGAYYNMQGKKNNDKNTSWSNKYTFTPKKGIAGFKVKATLGAPKIETFNSDVEISAQINTGENGGIEKIRFKGEFWVGTGLEKRSEAPITGNVNVDYDFVNSIFDLNASADINKTPITANQIGLQLYVNGTTDKWFFKCGDPFKPNTVNVGLGDLSVGVDSYFMFGNDIPIPNTFTSRFANGYIDALGHDPGFTPTTEATSEGSNAQNGKGIAMGIGYNFTAEGYLHLIDDYYAGAKGTAGTELNLSLLEYPYLKENGYGLNGWQAGGSIGFYASVGSGIYSKKRDKYREEFLLAEFAGGGYVAGRFPNPIWIKGEIAGRAKILCAYDYCLFNESVAVDFEYGEKIEPGPPATNITEAKADTRIIEVRDSTVEDIDKHIIKYVHPETTQSFALKAPIAVKFNVKPNVNFEVEGFNSKIRVFRFDTQVILQEENPISCNKENLYLNVRTNDIGEYLYTASTKLHLMEAQVVENQNNPTTNFQNLNQGYSTSTSNSNTSRENNLAPNTNYTFMVATILQEYSNGKWTSVVFNNKTVEEVVEYTFKTADVGVTSEELSCNQMYQKMRVEEYAKLSEQERDRISYISDDGKCECPRLDADQKLRALVDRDAVAAQESIPHILFEAMTHGQFTNQFNGSVGLGNGFNSDPPLGTTTPVNGNITQMNTMSNGMANQVNMSSYSETTVNYNTVNTATEGSFGTMQEQVAPNQTKGF